VALEELLIPRVRRGGRVGELRALADEILFTESEGEVVKKDYSPAYTEEREERVEGLLYGEIAAVERTGSSVTVRTRSGEDAFEFDREADAESFESLVSTRIHG
jgi:hypothetical protein